MSRQSLSGIQYFDDYGLFHFLSTEAELHLCECIGCTNQKAAAGGPEAGNGPIALAVMAEP